MRGEEDQGADTAPPRNGERIAAIMAGYLSQRLGWPAREAAPAEVAVRLAERGCSVQLAAKTAELLRACDAARFARNHGIDDNLAATSAEIIRALEAEPWS